MPEDMFCVSLTEEQSEMPEDVLLTEEESEMSEDESSTEEESEMSEGESLTEEQPEIPEEVSLTEEQATNAAFRGNFLQLLSNLHGRECIGVTRRYYGTTFKIKSFEPNMGKMIVEDLKVGNKTHIEYAAPQLAHFRTLRFNANVD